MNRGLLVSLLGVASVALQACSAPTQPIPSGGLGVLQLRDLTPALGMSLSKGSAVHLSFTLVSALASPGRVTLSVQNGPGGLPLVPKPSADIDAGGQVPFEVEFVVPADAPSVGVLVAFQPADAKVTPVVVMTSYAVH